MKALNNVILTAFNTSCEDKADSIPSFNFDDMDKVTVSISSFFHKIWVEVYILFKQIDSHKEKAYLALKQKYYCQNTIFNVSLE